MSDDVSLRQVPYGSDPDGDVRLSRPDVFLDIPVDIYPGITARSAYGTFKSQYGDFSGRVPDPRPVAKLTQPSLGYFQRRYKANAFATKQETVRTVVRITQPSLTGIFTRRYGSFASKALPLHPVSTITRLGTAGIPSRRYGSFSGKGIASAYSCSSIEVCHVKEEGHIRGDAAAAGGHHYNAHFFDPRGTLDLDIRPTLGFSGGRYLRHTHIECFTPIGANFNYGTMLGLDCINQVVGNLTYYDRWDVYFITGTYITTYEYTTVSTITGNHSFQRQFLCGAGVGQPFTIPMACSHIINSCTYFGMEVVFDGGSWTAGPGTHGAALQARGGANPSVITSLDISGFGTVQDYEAYYYANCYPPQKVDVSLRCFDDYGNLLDKRMIGILGSITVQDLTYTSTDLAPYVFEGNSPIDETRTYDPQVGKSQFLSNETGGLVPSVRSTTQYKVVSSRDIFKAALGSNCYEDDPGSFVNVIAELNWSRSQRPPYQPSHKMTPAALVTDRLIYKIDRPQVDLAAANTWVVDAEFGGVGSVTGGNSLSVSSGTVRFDLSAVSKNTFGFRYLYIEITSAVPQTVLLRISAGAGSDYKNLNLSTGTFVYEIDMLDYLTTGTAPRISETRNYSLGCHFKLTAGQSITVVDIPYLKVANERQVKQRGESFYSYDSLMRVDAEGIVTNNPDPLIIGTDYPDDQWHTALLASSYYTALGWTITEDHTYDVVPGWQAQQGWSSFPLAGVTETKTRKDWSSGQPWEATFSVVGKSAFAMAGRVWDSIEPRGALRLQATFIWGNGLGATTISGAPRLISADSTDIVENPWPTPWSTSITPSAITGWDLVPLPYSDPNTTVFIDPDYFTRTWEASSAGVGTFVSDFVPGDAYWLVIDGDGTVSFSGVCNLATRLGRYYKVAVSSNDLYLYYSEHQIPSVWKHTAQITKVGDASEPSLTKDYADTLRLLYVRTGPDVYEKTSFDDGQTWSTEAVAIAGGSHPKIRSSEQGAMIRAAYVAGKIQGTYQRAGDTSPSSLFTFKDDAGVDLAVEDDSFGLDFGYNASDPLLGAFLISGEAEVSDWYSSDEGRTWTRVN